MSEDNGVAPMGMPKAEPALRTAEVAKALGVSARAVRTWADDGKIACYRTFGGHRLFAVSEVRRVLASWGRAGMVAANELPSMGRPRAPQVSAVEAIVAEDGEGTARG